MPQTKTREVRGAVADRPMDRDQYIERLKADLERWNAELAAWETRLRRAQSDLHGEYEAQLAAWHEQRKRAARRLLEMAENASGSWQDVAYGADQVWGGLATAFARASEELEELERRKRAH